MYKHYEGYACQLKELGRREGVHIHDVEQRLLDLSGHMPVLDAQGMTAEGMQLLQELTHYSLSHKVIYVSTPLAVALMNSGIEMQLDNLKLPFRLFEVCFDSGFKIGEYAAPACLVMAMPDEALMSSLHGMADRMADSLLAVLNGQRTLAHLPALSKVPTHINANVCNVFSLRFKSPVDHGICHCQIDAVKEAGKQIDDILEHLDSKGLRTALDLNATEMALERYLLRIVLGIICYLNTPEPQISRYKCHNRKSYGQLRPTELLLGGDFWKIEPNWHLRKAHWRFLKDERYKRDDAGNVRCVWVRSAEVNRGAQVSAPAPEKILLGEST